MKLNVGVLFCNNAELVRPFFFFLNQSCKTKKTVIAVDNGSTDGTVQLLKQELGEDDILIENKENKGIAAARNQIVLKAKELNGGNYDNVFLFDSDVFITKNGALERMWNHMIANRTVGIFYAKVYSFYHDQGGFKTGLCFALIRKECFEAVGLFDEGFKMFFDDTLFTDRLLEKTNLNCLQVDSAKCVHMWGGTTLFGSEKENRKKVIDADRALFEKRTGKNLPEYE